MNERTAAEILNSPEAKALRKKRERLVAERNAALSEESDRWEREINLLQQRTRSQVEEIELGGGGSIAVWANLSEAETRLLGQLQRMQKEIVGGRNPMDLSPEEEEALNEVQYQILELVTVNPTITADWLRENPEKYGTQDLVTASIGYYLRIAERARRAAETRSFRPEQGRTELGRPARPSRPDLERLGRPD